MLVTGLAKQAPRPKRIDTLTLPLASFGDPLIAGVRLIVAKYKQPGIMGRYIGSMIEVGHASCMH